MKLQAPQVLLATQRLAIGEVAPSPAIGRSPTFRIGPTTDPPVVRPVGWGMLRIESRPRRHEEGAAHAAQLFVGLPRERPPAEASEVPGSELAPRAQEIPGSGPAPGSTDVRSPDHGDAKESHQQRHDVHQPHTTLQKAQEIPLFEHTQRLRKYQDLTRPRKCPPKGGSEMPAAPAPLRSTPSVKGVARGPGQERLARQPVSAATLQCTHLPLMPQARHVDSLRNVAPAPPLPFDSLAGARPGAARPSPSMDAALDSGGQTRIWRPKRIHSRVTIVLASFAAVA